MLIFFLFVLKTLNGTFLNKLWIQNSKMRFLEVKVVKIKDYLCFFKVRQRIGHHSCGGYPSALCYGRILLVFVSCGKWLHAAILSSLRCRNYLFKVLFHISSSSFGCSCNQLTCCDWNMNCSFFELHDVMVCVPRNTSLAGAARDFTHVSFFRYLIYLFPYAKSGFYYSE